MNYALMMQHRKKAGAALRKHDFAAAEKAFLAAIEEAEAGPQPNAYAVLQLKTLGVFYFSRGRLEEAGDYLRRALAKERQLLGSGSLEICNGLNLIGLLYHFEKRYDRAESAYREALEIQERAAFAQVPGASAKTYHMSLHHLAMVYCLQGKMDEAISLCQRASDRMGQLAGPGGRNLAVDFRNLSRICCSGEHREEALETCQWMLDLCFKELQREFLGSVIDEGGLGQLGVKPAHPGVSVESLADLYHEVWRPAGIHRQAPGQIHTQERLREETPGQPISPDHEDFWRPEKR